MKHVSAEELVSSVPVMTRTAKLQRWAEIVRAYDGRLVLLHNLEYESIEYIRSLEVKYTITAMGLAAADPVLNAAGLSPDATIYDVMKFFEISQLELHAFSCDCGGYLDNANQAYRIERLIKM